MGWLHKPKEKRGESLPTWWKQNLHQTVWIPFNYRLYFNVGTQCTLIFILKEVPLNKTELTSEDHSVTATELAKKAGCDCRLWFHVPPPPFHFFFSVGGWEKESLTPADSSLDFKPSFVDFKELTVNKYLPNVTCNLCTLLRYIYRQRDWCHNSSIRSFRRSQVEGAEFTSCRFSR